MLETFKTLIVEDDVVNSNLLKILLDKYCPNIEIVGIAKNAKEFIDLLITKQPEILLLDIDLGEEKNSLEILKEINAHEFEIIVTSSHEKYALKSINEHHVTSYVLKPIKVTNLVNAIALVEEKITQKRTLLQDLDICKGAEKIIAIPTTTTIDIIEIKDILYLEADGKYTVFHLANGTTKLVSRNIGSYEEILPKVSFYRIHHKYIVNIKKITTISKSDGNYCLLTNGKSLSIAKRRREELSKFLHLK